MIHYDGKPVPIEPAFEDYMFMMFDACDAMKLKGDDCLIFPMNGEIGGNAVATIVEGNRVIVYDRELSTLIGYAGAMAVMAHELAHHYCGRLDEPDDPINELEADRFAGAAMKNAGFGSEDALAMSEVFDARPSLSHPEKAERQKAILEGWLAPESAKRCR